MLGESITREQEGDHLSRCEHGESRPTSALNRPNEASRVQEFDHTGDARLSDLQARDKVGLGELLRQEQPDDTSSNGVTQDIEESVSERFCHVEHLSSQYGI